MTPPAVGDYPDSEWHGYSHWDSVPEALATETVLMSAFRCQFSSAEERNALLGDWDKEFTQTAPGRFSSKVFAHIGGGTLLVGEEFQGAAQMIGSAGRESCYLEWFEGTQLRVNGRDGWHREIAIIAPGAEFSAATPAGARAIRLSFFGATANRLQAELQSAPLPLLAMTRTGVHRPQVAAATRARFSELLCSVQQQIAVGSCARWSTACETVIDDSLYSAALAILLDSRLRSDSGAGPAGHNRRCQLAVRAKELLFDAGNPPSTVSELCIRLGASERLLELSFRAQFGVCPRKFMIALRLQRAHRALSAADPSTTVTSVATDLGFWHFSRFSQYYLQMFGILPSATLRLRRKSSDSNARPLSPWRRAIDDLAVRRPSSAA